MDVLSFEGGGVAFSFLRRERERERERTELDSGLWRSRGGETGTSDLHQRVVLLQFGERATEELRDKQKGQPSTEGNEAKAGKRGTTHQLEEGEKLVAADDPIPVTVQLAELCTAS